MPSSSKSDALSLCISILGVLLTISSYFFVADSDKLIALSGPGMIGLSLVCAVISIIITRIFFSILEKRQRTKKPFGMPLIVIVSFFAGVLTSFLVVFLLQKGKLEKAIPPLITDIQVSSEELIQENINFIETKISEYTESDIQIVNNRYVNFLVCENAGNLLYETDDRTELTCEVLGGKTLSSAMVIILDYETHDIIRTYYSDERGHVQHYSVGNEKFFCVYIR